MADEMKATSPLVQSFGDQSRWVNYRLQTVDGKVTKVPYTVTGQKASSTDPSTWSTHGEAVRVSEKVGIVFTPDQKLLGIDIDHCLRGGEIFHEQKEAIAALIREADTYTEISPSGEGLHLFIITDEPLPLVAHKKAPFECYTSGRYFTVTSVSFGESRPVRTVTKGEAARLLAIIGYPWGKTDQKSTSHAKRSFFTEDRIVLEKMFAARNGRTIRALYDGNTAGYGGDDSSADMALCAHLAFWTGKNPEQMERIWLASPLGSREKTQKRQDYRTATIAAANANCTETYKPRADQKTEGSDEKPKPRLWTVSDILAQNFGDEEWLVESLITKNGLTALSGNPGDYKTWTAIHIALCQSRGLPVFGKFPSTQGGVLIIDEEDHLRLIQGRLKSLGANDADTIFYLSQSGIKVDDEESLKLILEIIKEKDIKLVILDSLIRIHQQDENDAKSMAEVFGCIQKIIAAGTSALFTHHHRKQYGFGNSNPGQNMRGSSDILAAVDSHITIRKKKDEGDRLIVEQTKSRQAEALPPFELKIIKGELGPSGFEYAGDYDERKNKAEDASAAVVSVLTDGMKCRTELLEALKDEFGKTAIEDGIKIAEAAGTIEKVPKEELPKSDSRKAYYRLLGKTTSDSTDSEDDLPASQPYIETGKQEDATHDLFHDF